LDTRKHTIRIFPAGEAEDSIAVVDKAGTFWRRRNTELAPLMEKPPFWRFIQPVFTIVRQDVSQYTKKNI